MGQSCGKFACFCGIIAAGGIAQRLEDIIVIDKIGKKLFRMHARRHENRRREYK